MSSEALKAPEGSFEVQAQTIKKQTNVGIALLGGDAVLAERAYSRFRQYYIRDYEHQGKADKGFLKPSRIQDGEITLALWSRPPLLSSQGTSERDGFIILTDFLPTQVWAAKLIQKTRQGANILYVHIFDINNNAPNIGRIDPNPVMSVEARDVYHMNQVFLRV